MKHYLLSFLSLFLSLFLLATPASAKVILQEKGTVNIPATEIIDDDLFIGAENVNIEGSVTGSIFVGASSVDISGKVGGDVIAGTGNLNLSKALVGGNVIVGAGQVNLDDATKINGSLLAGTGNLKSSALVGRNVMVGAGSAYFNNSIGKELRFGGRDLTLGPKAKVMGDLTYALGEQGGTITQDPAATIGGTVTRYTPPAQVKEDMVRAKDGMRQFGRVAGKGFLVIGFLGSLLVGFLLLRLFPKTSLGLSALAQDGLWYNLGSGLLMVIAIAPVLLVLALTVVGLPLAGLLLLVFSLELTLAKLISSYAFGRFVAKQFSWNKMGVYAVFSIGLILFYLLRALPVVGFFTSCAFTWVGLGSLWHYTRSHLKNL